MEKNLHWVIHPLPILAVIICGNPGLGFPPVWKELQLILNQQLHLQYAKCVTSFLYVSSPTCEKNCLGFFRILATVLIWVSVSSSNDSSLFSFLKWTHFVFTFVHCNLFLKFKEDRWTLNYIYSKTLLISSAWDWKSDLQLSSLVWCTLTCYMVAWISDVMLYAGIFYLFVLLDHLSMPNV
jgi:hypothetical protein